MPTPGTDVILRTTPQPVSLPTDTGVAFVVGLTDRGPLTPYEIDNISQFETVFGLRQTYSVLYDVLDVAFREGLNRAIVSRVVGPGATSGALNLMDAVPAVSLVATAIGPGAWSAGYKVAVVAGNAFGFRIQVTDAANVVLEDSGDLLDQNAAVYWSANSKYIRLTLGAGTANPVPAAATVLSTGADDRASITDAQWLTALNRFSSDLGPGQVAAPGRTTAAGIAQVIDHANTHGRVGIVDYPNTPTKATLLTAVGAIGDEKFSAGFAPWLIVPGLVSGTTRTVPPSALVLGLLGRNDPGLGTNMPAAGNNGNARYVYDLSQPDFTLDQDRQDLNTAGVNLIRRMFNGIRVYGWRSLADATTDKTWLSFGNARLFMDLSARFKQVAENFMFTEINPETIGDFKSALYGECLRSYNAGELFGDVAEQAFSVDTSAAVNTPTTLANLELHATVQVKMSPFAEHVVIEVVKRQLAEVI